MSLGVLLVSSAPAGAVQHVAGIGETGPCEVGDEVPDLGQGERYEVLVPGPGAPFLALTAVRKAWASIDRVMCRYQPVYWRTW